MKSKISIIVLFLIAFSFSSVAQKDVSATTVPDDIGLAIAMGTNTKGTTTTNLMVDYIKVIQQRVS